MRKGVGQSLLGAEVMTEVTKKAVLNAIPVEVARVMGLNESLVGPETAVSFDTFMNGIIHTTKFWSIPLLKRN